MSYTQFWEAGSQPLKSSPPPTMNCRVLNLRASCTSTSICVHSDIKISLSENLIPPRRWGCSKFNQFCQSRMPSTRSRTFSSRSVNTLQSYVLTGPHSDRHQSKASSHCPPKVAGDSIRRGFVQLRRDATRRDCDTIAVRFRIRLPCDHATFVCDSCSTHRSRMASRKTQGSRSAVASQSRCSCNRRIRHPTACE